MSLEFKDVYLYYDSSDSQTEKLCALNKLSLSIKSGESVAIIGPSGCGKSSSLRLATGLIQPSSGQVLVDGSPIAAPRENTALILQDFGLLPWKTVYQNAELGLRVHGIKREERKQRTENALKQVGLLEFANKYPRELSGGMQQRLALARAIATDVDLLLMDEPLSALDALLRENLQNTLLQLWKEGGYTQVLVTHSIEEAVFLGQRIVVMAPRPGRVVEIIDNPRMGSVDYRSSEDFFAHCQLVRQALNATAIESKHAEDVDSIHTNHVAPCSGCKTTYSNHMADSATTYSKENSSTSTAGQYSQNESEVDHE